MNRREEIKSAYRVSGGEATFYDGMITCSTLLGKAVCRLVWDMGQAETVEYLSRAFSGVPEDFSGSLLEVPVGTGVLTMPIYQKLPDANITCLDYSEDMMSRAQRRAKRDGLTNVHFRQGDVGNLPFTDNSFDIVLSLNGFHAFPDKEAAYREVFRVLKPCGCFCGCFYVAGETARTDWFIRHLYEPKGFFTPPYETADSLKLRLERQYEVVEFSTVKSVACFTCRKSENYR
ncbi:MAG: class I SAM-dependent methyltransferase [Oscillospiraceae bacterium]|nr:class I SAM-dependent methyltransferase [Oscillospiraceae bacterium]